MLKLKVFIANILCSTAIRKALGQIYKNKTPSLKLKGLIFDCSSNQITARTKAQIYFGIYESAEYRFCKKYISKGSNIVELGSSIGLISSFISLAKAPINIIAVEANPELIPVIKSNFALNGVKAFKVVNNAIGPDSLDNLWFSPGSDNTTGVISDMQTKGSVKVQCTTLSELISQENFERFTLICDIEGGEVDILKDENNGLEKCNLMIMEIHTTKRNNHTFSIEETVKNFLDKGFNVLDRYGNTFVFSK